MNTVHYITGMPKQIPKLKEQILKTAERLFIQRGYEAVSMRDLAARVGIAVGTLYNYFPNKESLFTSLMADSWTRTFAVIDDVLAQTDLDRPDKLRKILEILYDGIKGRGGFARKALGLAPKGEPAAAPSKMPKFADDALFQELTEALAPLGAPFSGPEARRITQSLVAAIRSFLFASARDDREGDLNFLFQLTQVFQGEQQQ